MRRVEVLDDPALAAAELIAAAASAGGQIALAGGSTPRRAYEHAAGLEADFSGATVWFGDERCVPPDDERSNYAMVKASLLDRLSSEPTVHRMRGELGPDEGAADYEDLLAETFGDGKPRLDLILLGLGPDMHTASLFPGQPTLAERERSVVGVAQPGMEPLVPRITLTLASINASRQVVFLVAGADKADAVAGAFSGEPGAHAPASLVQPASGELTLLLDHAAAGKLEEARA
jgi:6-phosphogluconolactonase